MFLSCPTPHKCSFEYNTLQANPEVLAWCELCLNKTPWAKVTCLCILGFIHQLQGNNSDLAMPLGEFKFALVFFKPSYQFPSGFPTNIYILPQEPGYPQQG